MVCVMGQVARCALDGGLEEAAGAGCCARRRLVASGYATGVVARRQYNIASGI